MKSATVVKLKNFRQLTRALIFFLELNKTQDGID